jgi:hypothetical protein
VSEDETITRGWTSRAQRGVHGATVADDEQERARRLGSLPLCATSSSDGGVRLDARPSSTAGAGVALSKRPFSPGKRQVATAASGPTTHISKRFARDALRSPGRYRRSGGLAAPHCPTGSRGVLPTADLQRKRAPGATSSRGLSTDLDLTRRGSDTACSDGRGGVGSACTSSRAERLRPLVWLSVPSSRQHRPGSRCRGDAGNRGRVQRWRRRVPDPALGSIWPGGVAARSRRRSRRRQRAEAVRRHGSV